MLWMDLCKTVHFVLNYINKCSSDVEVNRAANVPYI